MKQIGLLKVVAVIAVAMLFSVISGADTMNNLKDIGSAEVIYAEEFDGEIPPVPPAPPSGPQTGVIMTNVTLSSPISTVQFIDSGIGLIKLMHGGLAWGDYNNDGNLDLAVCGQDSLGCHTKIYRNNSDGTFTDIAAGLTGLAYGDLAWGDYDNDGNLDLAICGQDNSELYNPNYLTKIYRNNGNGAFTDINAGLPAASWGTIAWGDYNNDGKLDLTVSGYTPSSTYITKICRNNGNGTFTDIGAGLPGLYGGALAWGDYNNDGKLDLVLGGDGHAGIFRNNGDDTFTDIGAGLPQTSWCSLGWGDYDNDGNLDLGICGQVGMGYVTKVYRNNGDSSFTDTGAPLVGVGQSCSHSLVWGDYDNDGDIDLVIAGWAGGLVTTIYKNLEADYSNPNTIPLTPENLTYESGSAILKWDAGFDEETPDNGLYYNVRVRKVSLAPDVVSGVYGSPLLGNYLRPKLSDDQLGIRLDDIPYGLYYWKAQTIDTGLEKSDWSDLSLFINSPTGHIVGWGYNFDGQSDTLESNDFVAIASGAWHNLAIKSDGSLVAWGRNSFGCCDVPEGNDFVAVAAGHYQSLALKSDGSLVGWGLMWPPVSVPEGNDFVAIACGPYDNLALKSDGSLVSWGWNDELPEGNDFIAIAAGQSFNIALRSDGSLAAAGNNYSGQCNVPEGNDFVTITAGNNYAVALKADGSLVAWGNNDSGQCDVPEDNDFVSVTAGEGHNIAIRADGSLVAWGNNRDGQCNVPEGNDFVAVAAGMWHSIALRSNTLPIADAGEDQTVYAWIDGMAEVTFDGSGSYDEDGEELTYLWISSNTFLANIATGVNPTIELPVGEYTIRLIVNDGIEDSKSDEVVINVVGAMKTSLQINPQVINRNGHNDWGRIMAWMQMPEDITKDEIDENTLLKMYPGDITAIMQHVIQYHVKKTQQTRIYAFFSRDELLSAVTEDGSMELTVVGKLITGQYFYGTDTVEIRENNNHHHGHEMRNGNMR